MAIEGALLTVNECHCGEGSEAGHADNEESVEVVPKEESVSPATRLLSISLVRLP